MIKIKFKKESKEMSLSFALQTAKIERQFSKFVFICVSACKNIKEYFCFKIKLLCFLLKALGANPRDISLKEGSGEILLSFSSQKSEPALKRLPSISYLKEKIVRGMSLLLILALLLQVCFYLILPIGAQQGLCSFDVDAVLLIDTTKSMADGAVPSRCQWTELRQIPGEDSFTHFLNKKYDITEEWCLNVRDSHDETSIHFTFVSPTYTPAVNSKIVDARESAKEFVGKLGPNDQSGLVSFDQTAVLLENLSDNFQTIKNSLDNLSPANTNVTNIGQAIERANEELASERANPQALKTAILLTDGQDSNTDNVNEKAQQAASLGYKIFTIGLGSGINQAMLQNIADTTGGQYYYAASQADLAGIFDEISQEICEFASLCQLSETAGQCSSHGQRERYFSWNYPYCGQNYTENFEDEACNCQAVEVSRSCLDDSLAEVNYTWNFSFCGADFSETKEDLSCSSEYQCGDWQSRDCVNDGARQEIRTCLDQYENSYEESRNITDESCNCLSQETSRLCVSNGHAEVNYTWNFAFCGADYSQSQADTNCSCLYTDWQNSECVGDGLRKQTRTQVSEFDFCASLERTIEDSSCQTKSEDQDQQPAGGGGGISPAIGGEGAASLPSGLEIYQNSVKAAKTNKESVTVSWTTNLLATSRVVYDIIPHVTLGEAPDYGYAYSTLEYNTNPKVTEHSVTITGLLLDTVYYWRAISRSSPEIVSSELSFTLADFEQKTEEAEKEEEAVLQDIERQLEKIRLEIEAIQKEFDKISLQDSGQAADKELSAENEIRFEPEETQEAAGEESKDLSEETSKQGETADPKDKENVFQSEGLLAAIGLMPFASKLFLVIAALIIAGLAVLWLNRKRKK